MGQGRQTGSAGEHRERERGRERKVREQGGSGDARRRPVVSPSTAAVLCVFLFALLRALQSRAQLVKRTPYVPPRSTSHAPHDDRTRNTAWQQCITQGALRR